MIEIKDKKVKEYRCDKHNKVCSILRLNDKEILIICESCAREHNTDSLILSLEEYIKIVS